MSAQIWAYLQTFSWNTHVWNASLGGPVRIQIMKNSDVVEEGTGSDFYATFCQAVFGKLRIRVILKDIAATYVQSLNTKSNAVATLLAKQGGSTQAINLANLILLGIDPIEQGKGSSGDIALVFGHESADGQTDPIS